MGNIRLKQPSNTYNFLAYHGFGILVVSLSNCIALNINHSCIILEPQRFQGYGSVFVTAQGQASVP